MLRGVVVALLLANLAFFAWSQGWLDEIVGIRARGDREPERLARQVAPESVVVLAPAAGGTPGVAAIACLEAGPFTPAEATVAESTLQATAPAGSWSDVRTDKAGTWLVYMGPYPDREALQRKIEEIRRSRPDLEEIAVPGEGEFGISLGRHDDRGAAERALALAQQRGIRTARVVALAAPSVTHMLRVDRADAALAARLAATKLEGGKGFAACATRVEATR